MGPARGPDGGAALRREGHGWPVWALLTLLLLVLPLAGRSGFAITLFSQMGVMVIFAMSFNMLYGQCGMLSFGHAVYSGLGAFVAVHVLNGLIAAGGVWATPVSVLLLPLAGGLGAALFGVVFGYPTTRRAGTPFAMITLGIGELVHAAAPMLPGFFGGEGGISINRVLGAPILGITFGPGLQVYYLIAGWCLASLLAIHAFSQTPLGRIANAVRDNPERAAFIGYNVRHVRFLVLVAASFFAGIAGTLSAIHFELVTAENVSTLRSGGVLFAAVIGGAAFFFGPALGAVVFVFVATGLSDVLRAWQLWLGLFFMALVMFAPGGLAGIVHAHLQALRAGHLRVLLPFYPGVIVGVLTCGTGFVVLLEMLYHRAFEAASTPLLHFAGLDIDTAAPASWAVAVAATGIASAGFAVAIRGFARRWRMLQAPSGEEGVI